MASKRHVRRKSCEGKLRYATEARAEAHAAHLRQKNGNDRYEAYRCAWGQHWHVGRRCGAGFEKRGAA